MNASVSVICYRHEMLANGESPIMLRIAKDGKRTMRSLGVSVNPAYWDFNKNEPKPNCPNKNLINKIILKTRLEFQEKLLEKKTGKQRTLRLNTHLQKHIAECYKHIKPIGVNAPILVSQKGTVFTVQRINVILKEVKRKYRLHVGNFSCHSLRKTFGRLVYTMSGDSAELALVKLMELFNHSNVAITKRYLGLRQEEILQTYDCLSF